jgi:hypothetical protein
MESRAISAKSLKLLARLDDETSNQLFEVLSDWDAQLKHLRSHDPQVPPCP